MSYNWCVSDSCTSVTSASSKRCCSLHHPRTLPQVMLSEEKHFHDKLSILYKVSKCTRLKACDVNSDMALNSKLGWSHSDAPSNFLRVLRSAAPTVESFVATPPSRHGSVLYVCNTLVCQNKFTKRPVVTSHSAKCPPSFRETRQSTRCMELRFSCSRMVHPIS